MTYPLQFTINRSPIVQFLSRDLSRHSAIHQQPCAVVLLLEPCFLPGLLAGLLLRRLLTSPAILADALLNWGDFPSCFLLSADGPDRLMVGLYHLTNLPIGLLWLR